ncbi:MAG: 50S ribosomal protein L23 [Candidatus Aureabacteria bacterium]|nr:50S ribosomal protein L23 [Candidatus Auribacterota bacterium]
MEKQAHVIVISPVISEKSTALSEKQNKYVFKVDKKANKIEIRKAIEEIFKVSVTAVNTMNYMGKKKRVRKSEGKTASWKKAVVTLKEGQKIDFT